jgi:hypothetical protein
VVRRALALVLLASGLKLLGVSNAVTGILLATVVVGGSLAWMAVRRSHGFAAVSWPVGRSPEISSVLRGSGTDSA